MQGKKNVAGAGRTLTGIETSLPFRPRQRHIASMIIFLRILSLIGTAVSGIWLFYSLPYLNVFILLVVCAAGLTISIPVLSYAMMPGFLLFGRMGARFLERGNKTAATLFAFLSVTYTMALLTGWCMGILILVLKFATERLVVPVMILSHTVAMAPWIFFAQKDQESGGNEYSLMATVFAEIAFIVVIVVAAVSSLGHSQILAIFGITMAAALLIECVVYLVVWKHSVTSDISSNWNNLPQEFVQALHARLGPVGFATLDRLALKQGLFFHEFFSDPKHRDTDTDEAIIECASVLADLGDKLTFRTPDPWKMMLAMAGTYVDTSLDDAVNAYHLALTLVPDDWHARANLAYVYLSIGKTDKAKVFAAHALQDLDAETKEHGATSPELQEMRDSIVALANLPVSNRREDPEGRRPRSEI